MATIGRVNLNPAGYTSARDTFHIWRHDASRGPHLPDQNLWYWPPTGTASKPVINPGNRHMVRGTR